jgi:dihydrofolate reductase
MDDVSGEVMQKEMAPTDLLLGRKTFEIFADYWPEHADLWPGINDVTKFAVSTTINKTKWKNTVFLKSIKDIKKLKDSKGSDLKVWGSSLLVHSLLKNDLVDELWLKIFPVTLGDGKKLFEGGAIPAAFTLLDCTVTKSGVLLTKYKRSGEVKTGSFA